MVSKFTPLAILFFRCCLLSYSQGLGLHYADGLAFYSQGLGLHYADGLPDVNI